ncbi:hypothetical protein M011DRAFT_526294 [Sporormia fimetaria CBS 119925]|uniref:Uncharacterized protein n=1 Tax=Sporormia fimetaria CBS 119925 TaxID=1340428 RepID=A0A6A6VDK4_9PLEO|nr:hypothetical protein M011DRAFT_526294 [Sporormia fimetaria CBS 119925]
MAPTLLHLLPRELQEGEPEKKGGISTGSIVALCVFAFFSVGIAATLTGFYFHRRAERNKLPPEKRPTPYRPYRSSSSVNTSDKASLLANAEPTDKSSMFSRDRNSSFSLYVDTEMDSRNKRASIDTVSLIPLHITPAEEVHDPLSRKSSVGSGVSSVQSARLSVSPTGAEETRKTRPRSTSATSMRYYEMANAPGAGPQVPKIVHTPSE